MRGKKGLKNTNHIKNKFITFTLFPNIIINNTIIPKIKQEQQHLEQKNDKKLQEKEQMRLRRLDIRQAHIEERLRKKQEKRALKIKLGLKTNRIEEKSRKHNLLAKEEKEKHYTEVLKHLESTDKKTFKSAIRNVKIINEKKGYGWKGLGSRRIVYDNDLKEYLYEVSEPVLSADEEEIKNKLIYLFRVRTDIDVFGREKAEKIQQLSQALEHIIIDNHFSLDEESKNRILYHILGEFVGYGKIDILMQDDEIEDISCDGEEIPIFIFHKRLESIKSNIIYKDAESLDSFVVKLSQMCGKQISVYEPIVDGKLADGARLQTTLAKTITKNSTFTIRKFREDPLTPVDLIANNTLSLEMAAYFWIIIEKGTSILFCGGTATGKTTMLNALSLFLPATFKIVSIEDTREINLPHENWIPGTTRAGFSTADDSKTGKDIDMFDLIRVAMRQRPKVIIVGEVRGKEAYTLFQAMTTGHLSYSTIHASDMHALIQRLESPPIELPRALLTALDLIVFLNSVTVKGAPVRRITNVTEVIKLDPETNRLVTLTPFHWVSEIEDRFESTGGSQILYHIKMQNGWTDERLDQELQNRKVILEWMIQKKFRSYEDVGRIFAEYGKDPDSVLKRIKEEPK